MKESKRSYRTRNLRSAVGKLENANQHQTVGGIMYSVPAEAESPTINPKKITMNSVRSAKNLYNVFIPVQAGTAPTCPQPPQVDASETEIEKYNVKRENYNVKQDNYDKREQYSELLKPANNKIKRILTKKGDDGSNKWSNGIEEINQIIRKISTEWELKEPRTNSALSSEELEKFVFYALRNNLKGHEKAVETLLKCHRGNKSIDNTEIELIKSFRDQIEKDLSRKKTRKNKSEISRADQDARAIRNQNTVVQVHQGQNNEKTFVLPVPPEKKPGKQSIKTHEKEGEKLFLSMFADLDSGKRMNILRRLRRLLDVYFWNSWREGDDSVDIPEQANKDPDFNVWEQHEKGKKREGCFIEVDSSLMQDADGSKKMDLSKKKEATQKLKKSIRYENVRCYLGAKKIVGSNANTDMFFEEVSINDFWIHHFENAVERIFTVHKEKGIERLLKKDDNGQAFKFQRAYLCEKVWKDALNFISLKYVATGKAVFHYAMNDAYKVANNDCKTLVMGKTDIEHITSFDYEMIKANETLQREVSTAIAFAANNLSQTVVRIPENGNMEDILLWTEQQISDNTAFHQRGGTLDAMLQFFGGSSAWDKNTIREHYYETDDKISDETDETVINQLDVKLVYDIIKAIYSLRNQMFHFHTVNTQGKQSNTFKEKVAPYFFEKDAEAAITLEKEKIYSNNLPRFYDAGKLSTLMTELYKSIGEKPAQIPAFGRVFSRVSFPGVLNRLKIITSMTETEKIEKWQSAVYYLLKEVYYNLFITMEWSDMEKSLNKAIAEMNPNKDNNNKEQRAYNDFRDRYNILIQEETDFGKICQNYMTEYNLQNFGNRKVRSGETNPFDKEIYKHYRTLLDKLIREAFIEYVKMLMGVRDNGQPHRGENEILNFLQQDPPSQEREVVELKSFLESWNVNPYHDLISCFSKNFELQEWYITCRFMNARTLNHLAGTLRSYVQYVESIEKRAAQTGNKLIHGRHPMVNKIRDEIIKVVDLCLLLSSRYSNCFKDYFSETNEQDAYAKYLSQYVNFGGESYQELKQFHEKFTEGNYVDEENPIFNRNIIEAKLFGPDRILKEVLKDCKVCGEDFLDIRRLKKEISDYQTKGTKVTQFQQEKILAYQRLKNKIELRNLVDFGEIINELHGQLINWVFLRERDLLYFQLGFHYTCLHNDNAQKPDIYKEITNAHHTIKNVVLYQMLALYVNGLGIIDGDGNMIENSMFFGPAPKIGHSMAYSRAVFEDDLECKENKLYNAGLEVFENVKDHKDIIINIRNTIEHFKYYAGKAGSILDLYSDIFDRFFTYDMKYAKNVVNLLENILLKHFVKAEFIIKEGQRNNGNKKRAQIVLKNLTSEKFTFNLDGPENTEKKLPYKTDAAEGPVTEPDRAPKKLPYKTDARDKAYLDIIDKLLNYPRQAVNSP